MSTRTNLQPQSIITNGSMAADITSAPTLLKSLSRVSYELSWSGTAPVGVAAVQVSNSYSLNPNGTVNNTGTWNTIATGAVSGATGVGGLDVITAFNAVRLIYTRTSGTGTMNATVNAKVA